MPTVILAAFWIVIITIVATSYLRQHGRRGPAEPDRYHHQAAREAQRNQDQRSAVTDIGLWQL